MKSVNLGLIGLGGWPREAYVPVLKELSEVRVAAVAARSAATRRFAQEQFGRSVALYDSYEELLRDETVDAVMLALPNRFHAESLQAAAASGKHVFFEPPAGSTESDVRQTLAALSAAEGVVQCDLELRCLPVVDHVRELTAGGAIGDPLMAKIRLWADWGHGGGEWRVSPEEASFFPWLACWYLDLLDCVFEAEPVRAHVAGGYAMNGPMMDHGLAALEYPGGRVGEFEFSLVAVAGLDIELTVLGRGGELVADLVSGRCRRRGHDGVWEESMHDCSRPKHGFEGMRESIVDFVRAVREGRPPRADLAVTSRVHAAMLACAKSEAEKRSVAVGAERALG